MLCSTLRTPKRTRLRDAGQTNSPRTLRQVDHASGGMDVIHAYAFAISAFGAMAALMLIQVLASDVVGIVRKHPPGGSVEPDHSNPLFRASRTVANTNESIAVYVCALLYCTLASAHPIYTGYLAWAFVIARALYAACYYANLKIMRSVCFGLSLLVLAAMLIVGVTTSAV